MKFLEAYYKYTKRTEPPVNFHMWTAISTISALLGRKCYIPQGNFTVFPQLYILLIGNPGTRKSTALNIGKDVLKSIDSFPIAPSSATREALIDFLKANELPFEYEKVPMSFHQATAFASEFSEFIGGKHINQHMIRFLLTLWDENPFVEVTRKSGQITIDNPYFTLLGACTPSWFSTQMKSDIIGEGFMRRTIFCLEETLGEPNVFPMFNESESEALQELYKEAQRISKIQGFFNLTDGAFEIYKSFYKDLFNRTDTGGKMDTYFSSKHILVLKLCMCLSAANDNKRIIDEQTLKLSLKLLESSERQFDKIFRSVGRNELKAYADQVEDFITGHEKESVSHKEILAKFYDQVNIVELSEIIDSLKARKIISLDSSGPVGDVHYRPTTRQKPQQEVNLFELAHSLQPRYQSPAMQVRPEHLAVLEYQRQIKNREVEKGRLDTGQLLRGKRSKAAEVDAEL